MGYAVPSFCVVPLGTAATEVPLPDRHECAIAQPFLTLPLFLDTFIQAIILEMIPSVSVTITSFLLNVYPQNQKETHDFRHFAEFL